MLLRLPASLHYPITVTELLKQPGDAVQRYDPLFSYYYRTSVTEGDGLGNKVDVVKTFPTRFESTVDGELLEWKIGVGDVIERPINVVEVDEPCAHEVQFGGMCANCGKDMTEYSYNTDVLDASRAPVRMDHNHAALTVSQDEATRVEEDAKRRLLSARKLSLVVDLDQTIIHATVDPTVGEWKEDVNNPNYEPVKDVVAFQLDDVPSKGTWYYVKLRPGLTQFLEDIAKLYELHIYTMGTRSYALKIASIVDPNRKLFGDRILSRDESGNVTAKNLQRLFPVDTKMVVIIDDRGDVWNWTPNLIKVSPFDFFVGIGDINSSFLPKKQELKPAIKPAHKPKKEEEPPKQAKPTEQADVEMSESAEGAENANNAEDAEDTEDTEKQETNEKTTTTEPPKDRTNGVTPKKKTPGDVEISALERLVEMGGGNDPVLLQEQANEQEEFIAQQVEDRPLLQKQKLLDAEDEAEALVHPDGAEPGPAEEQHDPSKHRHHLLQDNDRELYKLQDRLETVHQLFFDEYDRKRTHSLGGRVSALRGERKPPKDKDAALMLVPDVKTIMPHMKTKVMEGVVVVFSGVLPLGTDTQNADISLWAKSFGTTIANKVNSRTTHLVAGRNRTAKVREATRYPKVKIVTTQWLLDSIVEWKRLDEEPYLVPVHPDDRGEPFAPGENSPELQGSFMTDELNLSSSEEDATTLTDEEDVENADEEILVSSGLTELSPIGYDADQQAAIHDELKEFLGSDDEGSESESDASALGEPTSKKRKREGDEDGDGDGDGTGDSDAADSGDEEAGGSRLSQKIKRSHERSTGLREVANVSTPGSSENPAPKDDEEGDADGNADGGGDVDVDIDVDVEDVGDDEDDLEKEMMAAFEEPERDDETKQGDDTEVG